MRSIYQPSSIDKVAEETLWQSAVIVFDTSALLDFYYMATTYQEIMSDILEYLSDRIWIPAQVMYEYGKNRLSAMRKPVAEKYNCKPIQDNKFVDNLKACIVQWERQYYHPYIDSDKLEELKNALADIEPKIADIKNVVTKQYQKRIKEIKDISSNDTLNKVIRKLNCGAPFLFSEIKEIVKEGAYRYKNQIPPGYKDANTKTGIR